MHVMYGIPNCDTIKKARRWLEENGIDYRFHDYRKDGLERSQLAGWVKELGWEAVLNKRGTTWRKLPDEVKDQMNAENAVTQMLEQPAMIKRPLLDTGEQRLLGFKADIWQEALGA